jgi:hypothetical protein
VVLALPLAACSSTGSSDASSSQVSSTPVGATTAATVATTGTASGTVDRSGAASTTGTSDASKSTVGTVVTPAMAASATASVTVAATAATTTAAATTAAVTAAAAATAATAAAATAAVKATTPVAANTKSISGWVTCGGTTDQWAGVTKAFAAAKNNAFTLVVDCPVHLSSGLAIDKGIFIDNGTTVEFSGTGKFFVDNMFHPAFVIANSNNISLLNWNVEWDSSVPIDPNFGGYELNGKFVATPGSTQPAGAFNDLVLTPWLASNRSITFNETQGWVKSIWIGGINPAAVFFITGDTSNVVFSGLKLYVPAGAGGYEFIPMAISSSPNWKNNQTVTGKTPMTAQYAAVPHQLTFSGLDLDGVLMGWQGSVQDTMFENITSHRYGDLQDANGGNVGGIGKWFPPPHLFYLNTHATDPALFNNNVHFSNIVDEGIRVGTARDKGGSDSVSGYALSLKLGCNDCTVDTYTSMRPDGFMDVLPSDGLTVSNVKATFDSTFINNVYPAAIRFPQRGYSHITFENIVFTDSTPITTRGPMGNATDPANDTFVFSNVSVVFHSWAGSGLPLPTILGSNNTISLTFSMLAQNTLVSFLLKGPVTSIMEASPIAIRAGASTTLTWSSKAATSCSATGAWSGSVGTSGSKVMKVAAAGSDAFGLNCLNAGTTASAGVNVTAQ